MGGGGGWGGGVWGMRRDRKPESVIDLEGH